MLAHKQYDRHIRALNDTDLERFVRSWVSKKSGYHQVTSFTGPGDKGRDVVGHVTPALFEGDWHNYQCKQYGKTLPTASGIAELGKILYYAHQGDFTPPVKYFFVAPNGINRNLKDLIHKPTAFRRTLIDDWDKYCATTIVEDVLLPLTPELRAFIGAFDFERVKGISVDDMLDDPACKPVLYEWFGADPGPAPAGVVPAQVQDVELPYVGALVAAYGERDGQPYDCHNDIRSLSGHWPHLCTQRERYFDADAFSHFYRDSTYLEDLLRLRREVHHGIVDVHGAHQGDALGRVDVVMAQAAQIAPSGVLGKHAGVPVKQGLCHHFVNDGEMSWRK